MPQMAPLSWLMLFFFFGAVFMLFNVLNYFVYPSSAPTSSLGDAKASTSMNWKW
uniref:ATP synthase complex subunit 8 n=1 Tax=Serratella sp. Liaoning-2019 TaxID=2748057 RepID=A0A7D6J9B3_9INSE|nr:ATP synthase F0 subunit 8 [Serratella sp. Liaoning-2019]QLP88972.1 ATP synthase F0 subunit 8 [Serratella sp. Liaoning-2019]